MGRGGVKLAHALDVFGIDPAGAAALDVGASTGGFTDVLLRRGARAVVALDVGRGQLDWRLRQDPRVRVLERVHIGAVTPDDLPAGLRRFDVVTVDVSFISITSRFIDRLPPLLAAGGRPRRSRQAAVRGGPLGGPGAAGSSRTPTCTNASSRASAPPRLR